MARIKLKHVHLVRGKWRWIAPRAYREIGAIAEYLTSDATMTATALARAQTLNDWWRQALNESRGLNAPTTQPTPGTLAALIKPFEQSPNYQKMKPRTREGVDWALKLIRKSPIAKAPVDQIRPSDCRAFYQNTRETKGDHQAKRAITWLRKLLSFARMRGLIDINPAFKLEIEAPDPRDVTWTIQEISAFQKAAIDSGRTSIALAVQLAYDSSQRLGDVLAVAWTQFDGEGITWKQTKTGRKVWTPLSPETLAMLAATPRVSTQIIVWESTSRPYTNRGSFGRLFREVKAAAKITRDVTFHDLRRTAASEVMAGGGRAEPLTGHRPGSPVLRVYEVPDKEAARASQRARRRRTDDGTKTG